MTLTGTLRSLRATGGGGLFEGDLVCWALSSFLDSYTFILFYVSRFQVILFQTRVHGLNFFFLNRHFLPVEAWLQIPCCTHSVTPCIWPSVRTWNGAAHFVDQQTVPLRELIRKAHCTSYTYPGRSSPWQSHWKRTVTLSMAGNLGVRTEQIVGCSGLEAHFCHQICWATPEKLLDPSQSL